MWQKIVIINERKLAINHFIILPFTYREIAMNSALYTQITALLKKELIPALGCTEPIAIAYGSAVARQTLGEFPKKVEIYASGNIIKNVKSVIVPKTKDLHGVEASAILGIISGNPANKLEVLCDISEADILKAKELLSMDGFCSVFHLRGVENLHIIVKLTGEINSCEVELSHAHTNITKIILNDKIIFGNIDGSTCEGDNYNQHNDDIDNFSMTINNIFDYTHNINLNEIRDILERQISFNMAIANEGLINDYGAKVGKTILTSNSDIYSKAKAYAAAASDARMGGCTLPVIINSGSGNQGITLSVPIIQYALHKGIGKDKLLRALVLANLISIHQKAGIGKLSAYCGAVSAGCSAVCGIAFLDNANQQIIENIITNTLASISGMICDGAKASCASKIVCSLDAGFLGYKLAKNNITFKSGEGIVKNNIESTIASFSRMGREGMKHTDEEILNIMLEK